MRKTLCLAFIFSAASLAVSAASLAAPPAGLLCNDQKKVDCIRDDVLILNGDDGTGKIRQLGGKPWVTCPDPITMAGIAMCQMDATNWAAIVDRAIEVIKEGGGNPKDDQWDQFVIFTQDVQAAPSATAPGPLFYREGWVDEAMPGVNEVDGIGLPKAPRKAGRPLVGFIAAGSTTQLGGNPSTGAFSACGRAPRRPTDPPADQPNPALCYPQFWGYFDALAQATGALYGPYLAKISVAPAAKTGLVAIPMGKMAYETKIPGVLPRIWNSFLNMRGSIFAGNNYRDNGNGTWETTNPPPYFGVNPPYASTRIPEQRPGYTAAQAVRFQPLDLYLMGFAPAPDASWTIDSFVDAKEPDVYRPTVTRFDLRTGPNMGYRNGVAIRVSARKSMTMKEIVDANGGVRNPPFERANHFVRQLWIVITKPESLFKAGLAANADAKATVSAQNSLNSHIDRVLTWRRQFSAYFYMLTGYRGRLLTTYDGSVDDLAYYEFGQPVDDKAMFAGEGGIDFGFAGHESIPNTQEYQNVLRVNYTPGDRGAIRYNPAKLPLVISGDQVMNQYPTNAIAIRIRFPQGGPKGAFAALEFDNGSIYRIPATCGNPARAGCKEEGALIPDGKWRTYSATLVDDVAFAGKPVDAEEMQADGSKRKFKVNDPGAPPATVKTFTLVPSNVEVNAADPSANEALEHTRRFEIEFVRIGNVPSAKDDDEFCVPCDDCRKFAPAATCTTLCKGKDVKERIGIKRPDGWVDSEDNCPKHFNPLQEDGNEDGIGDACEDFDGDGVVNACDNCPTLTNSRQRDKDQDGAGDVCDGGTGGGCFLMPDAVAGALPRQPGPLAAGFFLGVLGLIALRVRRRK